MTQVARKDPMIDEAIDILNLHFKRCHYDYAEAFNTLGKVYSDFINEELAKCMSSPRYYLENYHTVKTEDQGFKTLFPFWDSQEIFYAEIMELMLDGKPVKVLVLKARQLGLSTVSEGLIFHRTIFNEATNALIVAQDPGQADYLFSMSVRAYDNLPWWMRPEVKYKSKGRYMTFATEGYEREGLNSEIFVEAANKLSGVSVGKSIRCAHMCLTDKNNVLLANGFMKSIADVKAGDSIRGRDGFVEVLNTAVRAEESRGYRITPWCNSAFPIEGTWNHEVLVGKINRAWKRPHRVDNLKLKRLDEITKKDALIIPVRPITHDGTIPATTLSKPRKQGGGNAGKNICQPLANREWGFLVGLYLAEGSITPDRDRNGVVSQTCISLDHDEQQFADRFGAACGVGYGKVTRGPDGSKSRVYHFYNAQLSRWLFDNFGYTDNKQLPDWCWTVGREFLSGVVEGMISGDGHVVKKTPEIYFTSVRYQLSCQLRDAVASLGHGYAGIYFRPAGFHYGRNCKDSWILGFGKEPGISMRQEYGWPMAPARSKNQGSHWMYSADKSLVAVRVRSVEKFDIELVYDIEVDSEDHLFRLPGAITHNSELSAWPDPKTLTTQIFPTMNAKDELAIMESTARGRQGFWYEFWNKAVSKWGDGSWEWKPIFIEWFRCPDKYSKKVQPEQNFQLKEEERGFRENIVKSTGFFIPDEMFNWKRAKIDEVIALEGDEWSFYQEYPANHIEAFQTSGNCAFPKKNLQRIMETTCCHPRWFGEIVYNQGASQPVKVHLVELTDKDGKVHPDVNLPPAERDGGRFRVWEKPEPGESYYVGADPAMGIEGTGDFSCAEVLKIGRGGAPDVQVAEWRGWINPTPFGHILAALGTWYNMCELALELNSVGEKTYLEVFRIIEYPNLFRWKHYDKLKNIYTDYMAWVTNHKTRDLIITHMRERIMENTVVLRSYDLLNEMLDFSQDEAGGRFEGQNTNDDRVMAMQICGWCAHDSDYGRQAAMKPASDGTGVHKYYVIDPLGRIVQECDTMDDARAATLTTPHPGIRQLSRPGWSVSTRVQRKDFGNTDYSPVHDKPGPRQDMHYTHGIPAESISLSNVFSIEGNAASDDWRSY